MLTSRTPPFSRYFCPLDCGWFHDAPEPGLWDEGPPISMRPDETIQDAVSRMAGGVLLDRIQKIETALREHVEKHTLTEAVTAIGAHREETHRLRRVLEEIRRYAESRCTEESVNIASASWVLHLLEGRSGS